MISILKAELFRLKKSKAYWVIFIINAGLTILGCLLLLAIEAVFKAVGEGSFLELLGMVTSATAALSDFASFSSDSAILALICTAKARCAMQFWQTKTARNCSYPTSSYL